MPEIDYRMMARALKLAEKGLYTTEPNPRVGCVLVKGQQIVGNGWHAFAGQPHAEINALRDAGNNAKNATAYVTLEPCCHYGRTSPCTNAMIEAGITRVVVAMEDPNNKVAGKGIQQLRDAGIDVVTGIMQKQAGALNPGFIKRMRTNRPYVRCKMGMSLDGRTAMASGESKWITGDAARDDVQKLRARSSAIMTGIGTVIADNPSLTVRADVVDIKNDEKFNQPLRVVLDSQLRLPVDARMLTLPGKILIFTTQQQAQIHAKSNFDKDSNVSIVSIETDISNNNRVSLSAVMRELANREINEVLLESGETLSGAMLQAGLIDEIILYIAPILMGHEAKGLFKLLGMKELKQKVVLDIENIRAVGDNWRVLAKVVSNETH